MINQTAPPQTATSVPSFGARLLRRVTHSPAPAVVKTGAVRFAMTFSFSVRREWADEVMQAAAGGGRPVYAATARSIIQHRAYLVDPITFCGRFLDQASTDQIRTRLGWNCRRCRRLARRITRATPRTASERAGTTC